MPGKNNLLRSRVSAVEIKRGRKVSQLLKEMGKTGFQGRKLSEVANILIKMAKTSSLTIILGYSGSLSVAGQWKQINWLIENNLIDILVPTGANISEDIVEAMGYHYYQGDIYHDDRELFKNGMNRYYDIYGQESDYLEMTEMIAEFILTLDTSYSYTSREFLYLLGCWLLEKNIDSIVSVAAKHKIPIYCPAIADSPFGDAALIANSKGFTLKIDAIKDYIEFMSLANYIEETGVIYIGGGVPKDFIQLLAVTADLLYEDRKIPNRMESDIRKGTNETYYPHKYAVQITTDSPQWGGLSGCTFEEAVSWGKETKEGRFAQCYCDATIALPIVLQAMAEELNIERKGIDFSFLFP